MLDPTMRHLLLDGLRPPQGSHVDSAVATTFTLDLSAALLPPIAFTSFGLEDGTSDPVVLLESIRRAADRVTIFCQAGMIGVPQQAPDLVAFLEPMVHQVAPPRGGLFHPKMWLLKFVDDAGTPTYRLLVMSRNLAHDNSWDLIVRLDSTGLADTDREENDDLFSFVSELARTPGLASHRRRAIAALARDVRRVEWELPEGIESLTFHHLRAGSEPIDWRATRACVISPFVNDEGLQTVTEHASERHVVARPGQLDLLKPDTVSGLQTYVLDPASGSIPSDADDFTKDPESTSTDKLGMLADLHAKLYVLEPAGSRWSRARVLIGSANATSAALASNVELMVEMVGAAKEFGVDSVIGPDAPMRPLIQSYPTEGGHQLGDRDDLEAKVESAVRMIASLPHSIVVEPDDNGSHTLRLTVDGSYPHRDEWECEVGLLTRPGRTRQVALGTSPQLEFDGVPTADVTAFVTVRVSAPMDVVVSTVVVADLDGAPTDRLDQVIARQIDTPDKLMRLIRMLLDFGNPALLAELTASNTADGTGSWAAGSAGELEMVLRALATNPKAIDSIDDLIRRLERTEHGRTLIGDEWGSFWQTVREARKQVTA
ncbi:phospholipase D family protein [Luteipulveratus halotolerans]|uniref:PLD phosphodiesterase domain-containing protein n=1 Tax=Luteipulveratus halotolerans TaxID=1631356 RepID=A0A0L6CM87_9MICO|nr:phospholipase D family protein [Luteipulveratus halotolerans]KNX38857.1 hypothetical protein VV01_19725 [Luteipulveratus halotolerans]